MSSDVMSTARPIYETMDTLAVERKVADWLEKKWSCTLVKLPRAYNYDYAAMRGITMLGWVEIKRRYRPFSRYPTVFFPVLKLLHGWLFHTVTGRPCLFVVQFDDCLVYTDVLEAGEALGFDGRKDRDDPADMEPMLLIPNARFRYLKYDAAED